MRGHRDVVYITALLLLTVLTWLPRLHGPIEMRWDAGIYYILGTSLAQGSGYRLLNEPGDIHAVQYPPLIPAIIALHQRALGTSNPEVVGPWLKLTWFVLFAILIVAVYFLFKRYVSRPWAFLGAALCALNFHLYFHASQCAAELPFAVAAVAFLLANRKDGRPVNEVFAGVAAVAAFLARTIGIALLGAWVADALLRRKFRRAAIRGLVALAPLLLWNGYIRSVEHSPEYRNPAYPYQRAGYVFYNVSYAENVKYKDPFRPELGLIGPRDMAVRLLDNGVGLPARLGAAVTSHEGYWDLERKAVNKRAGFTLIPPFLVKAALIAAGCLVLAGTVLLLLRRDWPIALSILATIAAACSAPWPSQIGRYVAPIIPMLLIAVFALFGAIRTRRRIWKLAAAALALFVLAETTATYYLAHTLNFGTVRGRNGAIYRQLAYEDPDRALDASADWIAAHARSSDVIAASMPGWIYLRSGLKTVMQPLEASPEKAQALLESVPVRYLIVEHPGRLTSFAWSYMSAMLSKYPDKWKLVYQEGDWIRVYESDRGAGNPACSRLSAGRTR